MLKRDERSDLAEALERWLLLRIDTRDALDIETFLDVRRLVARLLANRREGGGQDPRADTDRALTSS